MDPDPKLLEICDRFLTQEYGSLDQAEQVYAEDTNHESKDFGPWTRIGMAIHDIFGCRDEYVDVYPPIAEEIVHRYEEISGLTEIVVTKPRNDLARLRLIRALDEGLEEYALSQDE